MITSFYSSDFYNSNKIEITADVIDKCNFSCKYCYNNFPRKNIQSDLYQLKNFVLSVQHLTKKNIQVSLIGGETTLHSQLHQFCNIMHDNNISCCIYSNFSMPYELYDSLPDNVEFIITWHYAKNNIFEKNFSLIQSNKLNYYNFVVMFEHDNIEESIRIYKFIQSRTNAVMLRKVFNTANYKIKYSNEQLIKFDDLVHRSLQKNITTEDNFILEHNNIKHYINDIFIDETINPFKYWRCYAGLDNFFITIDGNIYPCATLTPQYTLTNKYCIGNISNKSFNFKRNLICQVNGCCNYEIKKENVLNKKFTQFLQQYV